MNGMKTTIDGAGRMVIPKPIREMAGLKAGASVEVRYQDGRIEIEPAVARVELVKKGRFLVARAPGAPTLTHEEVNRTIRQVRDGRT